MTIRIRIEHGQHAGQTWRLGTKGVYSLGRGKGVSLHVLDMKVSKTHAEFTLAEGGAVFTDLESTHGSQINGQPLKGSKPIQAGDELRVGLTILRALSDGPADIEATPIREVAEGSVAARTSTNAAQTSSVSSLPPDALVGKTLGGYRVERKIGQGGMGAVYIAEQISLHRKVALKVLSEKFVKDSAFVDQFLNEARAAGALNHPNVVQVYDVGDALGNYYFSMEVVTGGSIEERLGRGDKPGWEEGLNWFLDATNALVFAQRRDILHRDVKPDNLMIAEDGSAKLCDLGLAKRSENSDLMSQGIIGTPHFISPEAVRRKSPIDHRTDLYSLGCTFYRIFTGKNPFPGTTVKEILLGHLKKPVPTIGEVNKEVPRELSEIVERLMQKAPDDRFQTPDELLQALDKVRVRHGLEAHGIAPKSRKPIIIGAIIALLVAIGAVVFAVNQEPAETFITIGPDEAEQLATEARVRALDLEKTANVATTSLGDIDRAFNSYRPTLDSSNWREKKPQGDAILTRYETWADDTGVVVTTMETEQAAEDSHEVVVAAIAPLTERLKKDVDHARSRVTKLRKYFADRLTNEKADAALKTAAREMATKAITDHQAKVADLRSQVLEDEDPRAAIGLPALLDAEVIRELVNPALAHAVSDGEPLLNFEKHFQKALEDAFNPQTDLDKVTAKLKNLHTTPMTRAKQQAKGEAGKGPSIEGYETAIATLNAWTAKLPETAPGDINTFAKLLGDYRKAAEAQVERLETARDTLLYAGLKHDRDLYHTLIVRLRAPLGLDTPGALNAFQHDAASAILAGVRDQFKTTHYAPLIASWTRDLKAYRGLFGRLQENLKKCTIQWVDEAGKKQKVRVQGAGPGYITTNDSKRPQIRFTNVTKDWLIKHLFFDEETPRCTLESTDYRGLGLLSEMAGNFDAATKHYTTYMDQESDEAVKAEIAARIATFPAERVAADKWLHAQKLQLAIVAFLDEHDPSKGVEMTNEMWGAFEDEKRDLDRRVGDIQTLLDELATDAKLAGTMWGASLNKGAHDAVTYAGDSIPKSFLDADRAEKEKPAPVPPPEKDEDK